MKPASLTTAAKFDDVVAALRHEYVNDLKYVVRSKKDSIKEAIQRQVQNREALPLLQEAGFEVTTNDYGHELNWLYIDLGSASKGGLKGRAFVEGQKAIIAKLLKCHLEEVGKEVANGKKGEVKITLSPSKYPGVRVSYTDKLPQNGPCKIVKSKRRSSSYTSYDVVCEVASRPS